MGRMGRALAERLLDGGHDVSIWNRSQADTTSLTAAGARRASSPVDAAGGADVVMTSLRDDAAVHQVVLGDGGLCAVIGNDAVLVDCSTVSPATSDELEAKCKRFVALPILGPPDAVRSGKATYLAGGHPGAIDAIQPVLTSLSSSVRRYGAVRLAACAKLASNLLLLVGIVGLAEAFAVGRAGGLTDDQLRELFGQSPLVAPALANRFEAVLAGATDGWWTVALGAKDAGLAVGVAEAAHVAVPVTADVRDLFASAAASGLADADIAAIAQRYRRAGPGPAPSVT
jgi:3-hydroxyisobutyrate dehydrogenase